MQGERGAAFMVDAPSLNWHEITMENERMMWVLILIYVDTMHTYPSLEYLPYLEGI